MKHDILFITRNYPPKVGGLEAYSYNLIKEFHKRHTVHRIALTRSNRHLIWFLPYALVKASFLLWRYSLQRVHLCDGLLAPIGIVLKRLSRARVSISIHGLDMTYGNLLYQLLIPRCVARLDKIICVSRATRDECVRRGISAQKCFVVPNGIRPGELDLAQSFDGLRAKLAEIVNTSLEGKTVLFTVGRLVKRKGVAWFIEHVMPELDSNYIYLVAGYGPEYACIQRQIAGSDLKNRVFLLGSVSDEMRKVLYNASDIFIMPNVTVENDIEGFGIVIIEAGSCGLPVVASNIQGIRDAVVAGKTGFLAEEKDADRFRDLIKKMDLKREEVRSYVNATFDWAKIYERYQSIIFDQP